MILELPRYDVISSGGESDAARFIAGKAREARQALRETYTFGRHAFHEALRELVSIKEQCRLSGWDGYDSEPVRSKTIWSAYRFLEALPPGFPTPSVGAEPDGDITLEWYRSPRKTISVSVSPDDNLHYSALLGPNKHYGTEAFFGEVPASILDLIRRVQS